MFAEDHSQPPTSPKTPRSPQTNQHQLIMDHLHPTTTTTPLSNHYFSLPLFVMMKKEALDDVVLRGGEAGGLYPLKTLQYPLKTLHVLWWLLQLLLKQVLFLHVVVVVLFCDVCTNVVDTTVPKNCYFF